MYYERADIMNRSIYDINADIEACVDIETGEVDVERLESLEIERDAKIENMACYIKDLDALINAIADEQKALGERKKSLAKTRDNITALLKNTLQGEKFKTARCAVSYRKSKSVVCPDVYALPAEYWNYGAPTANKTAIKDAITSGVDVPGAWIEENTAVIIK